MGLIGCIMNCAGRSITRNICFQSYLELRCDEQNQDMSEVHIWHRSMFRPVIFTNGMSYLRITLAAIALNSSKPDSLLPFHNIRGILKPNLEYFFVKLVRNSRRQYSNRVESFFDLRESCRPLFIIMVSGTGHSPFLFLSNPKRQSSSFLNSGSNRVFMPMEGTLERNQTRTNRRCTSGGF